MFSVIFYTLFYLILLIAWRNVIIFGFDFFPTARAGTHGRVLQGTRPTAALRPRVTGQRHQARATVRGQGVVHVVGRRADSGDLPEAGLGTVPAPVPVAVRVRGPVGGEAAGARGRGPGGVQPNVRHRFRVLRVAKERVLLRAGRPPEPDVRVPVRARIRGRTGPGDRVPDSLSQHDVRDGDRRPDGSVAVRVRRRQRRGRGLGRRRRVQGRRDSGPGNDHTLPVAGHRAPGGVRLLRATSAVHVRIVSRRGRPRRIRRPRHERDAGPPRLRVLGRVRVLQGVAGGQECMPRRPQAPAPPRPGWLHRPDRRSFGQRPASGHGRVRRFPVAHRSGHGRQQHVAHRRLRVHEVARLRDPAVAHQLVHVPDPEPGGGVHRGGRRAQKRPSHLSVRHGGQLQRAPRLVRGVLARLG